MEQVDRVKFYKSLHQLSESSNEDLEQNINALFTKDVAWRGSEPMNEQNGTKALLENIWRPLKASFPDMERRDSIFMAGTYEGRQYIASVGHYCANFEKDWLTIRATGHPVYIRYGEVHEIKDGKIVQSNCLWDVLDVIRQAGFWPLPPSTGAEGRWSGPNTGDGIQLAPNDPVLSAANLEQTLLMQKSLGDNNGPEHFTREGLINMEQKKYWHPKMMWYGPSGVGTTRSLPGFVDYHQLPFRLAFPNRMSSSLWEGKEELMKELNAGHYIRVGDGNFSVTGGWPSVVSPHDGEYLGSGATGKLLQMRVMDFYHHDEGLIRENWVPIDIIFLLKQMGVDVFQRMHNEYKLG
ncbi:MAG: hypothetical protein AB8B49_03280 [Nitratireductor sp.]